LRGTLHTQAEGWGARGSRAGAAKSTERGESQLFVA